MTESLASGGDIFGQKKHEDGWDMGQCVKEVIGSVHKLLMLGPKKTNQTFNISCLLCYDFCALLIAKMQEQAKRR